MGISERTARRWIKSGKLRAYKPGRDYWIPESALRELVEESEVHPKAERRSSLEPSFNDVLEDERHEGAEPPPAPGVMPMALGDEPEEVLPPKLEEDIDAAFDRAVDLLRKGGAGEEFIAEVDGPIRQRAFEEVAPA